VAGGEPSHFSSASRLPPPASSALDLLAALIDKSLVQQSDADAPDPRFTMLETVREFAQERLEASGDEGATREAHAAYYLALAEAAARDEGGAGDSGWMRRLTPERPNLWAALDWFEQTGRTGAVLQMSGALSHYWYLFGDLSEGQARLERALAAAPAGVAPLLRARALLGAGVLARQSTDHEQSRTLLEASLATYRALGDWAGAAWALNALGCLFSTMSEEEQAEAYLSEALAIFRELGDPVGAANLTSNLGELAVMAGQHDQAIAHFEAALSMWRAQGNRVGAVRAMIFLGQALLARGEAARVEGLLREALTTIHDAGYEQILPAALRTAAQVATARGAAAMAARWYGAEEGLRAKLGMELSAVRRASHERTIAIVRATMGEQAFATAWAAGRCLSAAQAIAEVLADCGTETGDSPMLSGSELSPREREVLRLLAAGRSDHQIADALFITRRTASKHVSSILAKLGVQSRTAAAAVAHRDGFA
jgi:DNA-binding CsgD family transcriptional regulator/tetratricopeptide (TPR) repeat protein